METVTAMWGGLAAGWLGIVAATAVGSGLRRAGRRARIRREVRAFAAGLDLLEEELAAVRRRLEP
jgi:hypothetical protein